MSIRILIVDDSAAIRKSLIQALQDYEDIEVCGEAADGRECIAKVDALTPNVVVLDVSMPVMNGLEAARILKDRNRDIRILLYSSFDTELLRAQSETLGVAGLISKSERDAVKRLASFIRCAA